MMMALKMPAIRRRRSSSRFTFSSSSSSTIFHGLRGMLICVSLGLVCITIAAVLLCMREAEEVSSHPREITPFPTKLVSALPQVFPIPPIPLSLSLSLSLSQTHNYTHTHLSFCITDRNWRSSQSAIPNPFSEVEIQGEKNTQTCVKSMESWRISSIGLLLLLLLIQWCVECSFREHTVSVFTGVLIAQTSTWAFEPGL
jgi:hypothetical protein